MKSRINTSLKIVLSLLMLSLASVSVLGDNPPPSCTLDLDIDSDNDNGYLKPEEDYFEEDIEMISPGKIVMKNKDDDDNNGLPDCEDSIINGIYDDQDMAILVLKHVSSAGCGTVVLEVSTNEFIRVFKKDGTLLIGPEVGSSCTLAVNGRLELLVEGMKEGQVVLQLTCNHGKKDEVLVTVVDIELLDLDIDSDNDNGYLKPEEDYFEEDIEMISPGKIVMKNKDDDDNNGLPDCEDSIINGIYDEQDMAILVLKHVNSAGCGTVVLEVSTNEFIRVFKKDGTLLIGPEVGSNCTLAVNGRMELLVEGMKVGQAVLTLTSNQGKKDDVLITVVDIELGIDFDGDGMPDGWEMANGFDPLSDADATQDADGDGLSNLDEYLLRTPPRSAYTPSPASTPASAPVYGPGLTGLLILTPSPVRN